MKALALICLSAAAIDGDTLRCSDGTRIRLWGIQAAERHEPGGPAATKALSVIITGETLACEPRGRSFDRIVARCTLNGQDVAGMMVRQGQAVDWPRFSAGHYAPPAPD